MKLTLYTDFGLRMLIALAVSPGERSTVSAVSGAYGISRHHLVKVVGRLAALGYVETLRGKGGGVRLARRPAQISIGQVVRDMEAELGVVECLEDDGGHCVVAPACRLKSMLRDATGKFLAELDGYTLAEVVTARAPLARLLGIPVRIETGRA
ncbi:MAG TPA: Rrf2 family transcriptional regulator [Steroidobacteraceae bacterium]|nr:Rrf2 family transcriptional regulator [Steroidobacteraceae bacterium]